MNKRHVILFSFVFLVFITGSVSSFEFDNVKFTGKDGIAGYPNIEIKNLFGLGSTLWDGELTKNTNTCGSSCSAEKTITIYDTGSLIDDVRFETITETDRYEQNIRSYQFYIKTGEEEIEVDDYEWVCIRTGIVFINGTEEENCEYQIVGSHIEITPLWGEYELGQEIEAGTYEIKLEGKKKPSRIVDWQIKSKGIWIDDWAIWNSSFNANLTNYYKLDKTVGDIIDSFGGINGTNVGAGRGLTGKIGNAFNFSNDITKYSKLANITKLSSKTNFTVNLWVNPDSYDGDKDVILSMGYQVGNNEMFAILLNNGVVRVAYFLDPSGYINAYSVASTNVELGKWSMITVTRAGNDVSVYQNGTFIEKTTFTVSGVYSAYSEEVHLGKASADGQEEYSGLLDEIGIWNTTLTQPQITDLWNNGLGLRFGGDYVILNSPEDNYVSPTGSIDFNCTGNSFDGATIVNMSLWTNETGSFELEENISLTGTTNETVFTHSILEGKVLWNCQVCDSDSECTFGLLNRTVSIDTTAPQLNITYPIVVDYHQTGQNLTLNWTISEINLDSCWYNYNETTNVSVTCADNTTSFNVTDYNDRDLYFYANDTVGNLNTTFHEWDYRVFGNSINYVASTLESSFETFEINMTYNSSLYTINTVTFDYNNTERTSTTTDTGNNRIYSNSFNVDSVTSDTNVTFFWQFTMTNGTGTTGNYDSISSNQSVRAISIDNCTSYSVLIYNFTARDEESRDNLSAGTPDNVTIEVDLRLSSWGTTNELATYSKTFAYTNPATICLNLNLSDTDYRVDMDVGYSALDYVQEFYFVSNGTLSNTTSPHIDLHDLLATDSTTFLFAFIDSDGLEVEDAIIHTHRKYIGEGIFREVERSKSDDNGETHVHLVEEDVIYYFTITLYDQLLYTSSEYQAKCISTPCEIKITATEESSWDKDLWDKFDGGDYTISKNDSARTVTMSFTTSPVQSHVMNLTIYEFDNNGNDTIFVVTDSVTASSGTIELTVPASAGNETFIYVINANGELVIWGFFSLIEKGIDYFGGVLGVILSAFIVLTLVLMAVTEGVAVLIFLILGLILVSALKLLDINWVALMSLIMAGGILIWKLTNRRSRR